MTTLTSDFSGLRRWRAFIRRNWQSLQNYRFLGTNVDNLALTVPLEFLIVGHELLGIVPTGRRDLMPNATNFINRRIGTHS
jgi:hypothetical protein